MDPVSLFKVPTFGQDDLAAFHEAHFGQASTTHFDQTFLKLRDTDVQDYEYQEDDEEDGLGYYPDGVKRTLTDEQIAIFRHSEEEALRRAAEKTKGPSVRVKKPAAAEGVSLGADQEELEEGEEVDDDGIITKLAPPKKKNKNKKRKGNRQWQKDQKPDLRRRTWDVVDKGVGSLDYDDMEGVQATTQHASKRKRISYDD